jgi:hypothetical protein
VEVRAALVGMGSDRQSRQDRQMESVVVKRNLFANAEICFNI